MGYASIRKKEYYELYSKNDKNFIEITPWISLENGINVYDVLVNEREYFESKGFKFDHRETKDKIGTRIKISW